MSLQLTNLHCILVWKMPGRMLPIFPLFLLDQNDIENAWWHLWPLFVTIPVCRTYSNRVTETSDDMQYKASARESRLYFENGLKGSDKNENWSRAVWTDKLLMALNVTKCVALRSKTGRD